MKTLSGLYFAMAFLLLGFTSDLFAETGDMAGNLQKMVAELNLTPKQKEQAAPIVKEHAQHLEALKADTGAKKLQKLHRFQQEQESFRAKLNPILNPEQQKKLVALQEQNRKQMMESRMH